ncbi:hypothetical protein BC829DRAFT_407751 [Chytridium lagenaria]|nr:hypothetical protein BC829DRAFT_407751 [Chytridium lagenaria]
MQAAAYYPSHQPHHVVSAMRDGQPAGGDVYYNNNGQQQQMSNYPRGSDQLQSGYKPRGDRSAYDNATRRQAPEVSQIAYTNMQSQQQEWHPDQEEWRQDGDPQQWHQEEQQQQQQIWQQRAQVWQQQPPPTQQQHQQQQQQQPPQWDQSWNASAGEVYVNEDEYDDYYPSQNDEVNVEDQDLVDSYRVLTLERIQKVPKEGAIDNAELAPDQEADDDLYAGYAAITDEYGNTVPASTFQDEDGGLVILTQDGGQYYVDKESYTAVAEAAQQQYLPEEQEIAAPDIQRERAPSELSYSRRSGSAAGEVRDRNNSNASSRKPTYMKASYGGSAGIQLDFKSAEGDDWAGSAFDAFASQAGARPFSEEEKESAPTTVKKFHLPQTRMKYMNSLLVDLKEQEQNVVLTAIREGASMPEIPAQYRRKVEPARGDSGVDNVDTRPRNIPQGGEDAYSVAHAPASAPIQQQQEDLYIDNGSSRFVAPSRSITIDETQRAAHRKILERHQAAAAAAMASMTLASKLSSPTVSPNSDHSPNVQHPDPKAYPSPPRSPPHPNHQNPVEEDPVSNPMPNVRPPPVGWAAIQPQGPESNAKRTSLLILHIPPPPRHSPPPGVASRQRLGPSSLRNETGPSPDPSYNRNSQASYAGSHRSQMPRGAGRESQTFDDTPQRPYQDHRISLMGVLELDPRPSSRALEMRHQRMNGLGDPENLTSFVTPDHIRPSKMSNPIKSITVPTLVSSSSNLRTIPIADLQRQLRERGKLGGTAPAKKNMLGLAVLTGGKDQGNVASPSSPSRPTSHLSQHGPPSPAASTRSIGGPRPFPSQQSYTPPNTQRYQRDPYRSHQHSPTQPSTHLDDAGPATAPAVLDGVPYGGSPNANPYFGQQRPSQQGGYQQYQQPQGGYSQQGGGTLPAHQQGPSVQDYLHHHQTYAQQQQQQYGARSPPPQQRY